MSKFIPAKIIAQNLNLKQDLFGKHRCGDPLFNNLTTIYKKTRYAFECQEKLVKDLLLIVCNKVQQRFMLIIFVAIMGKLP